MSFRGVRDGLMRTLANSGHWSASQISACDFGIAEFTSCAIILQPGPNQQILPLTYGGRGTSACGARNYHRIWDIAGVLMVKDPGDAKTFLAKLWQGVDDLYGAVAADDTLDGSACTARLTTISRPSIDAFLNDGNTDWAFLTFGVQAEEL